MKPSQYRKIEWISAITGKKATRLMRIKRINPHTGEMIYACLSVQRRVRTVESPSGEGFFVIDESGNLVVDEDGNVVTFIS